MPGLYKHPDGSLSRVAIAYDGTQTGATVRQADGTDIPVIDFHTRTGEFGNTQLALAPLISIIALDVSAGGLWSWNGNSGIVNKKRNYVPPGGPVTNPAAGWTGGSASAGSSANVTSNSSNIQVSNTDAGQGVAYKTFSVLKGNKYVISTTFQTGGTPGTSFLLRIGRTKYGSEYGDLSQASGVVAPSAQSLTITATSTVLYVTLGNQAGAGNISLWSVPTVTKG